MPERLIVSGCDAPQIPRASRHLHTLDDDALIDALRKFNGTPSEILENRELMALLLPIIRADFRLLADYQYHSGPLLNIPVLVLTGTQDNHVSWQGLGGWQNETMGVCRIRSFEGDHFFIHSARDAVLACLSDELDDFVFCGDEA
jgi:surfactin synthase thioesterase subunit